MTNERDYTFHNSTISFCNNCKNQVQSKIIFKQNQVYIKKLCSTCGETTSILEENQKYYETRKDFNKPSNITKTETKTKKGCPFDCGLCPDHDQHTCIGLIEITNSCNLNCPLCYANSEKGEFLELNKIEQMMDFFQEREFNKAEILQISGGEPTVHPQIIKILKLAKTKNFKFVMLNTNGLKLANDENFVKEIANIYNKTGGFEIYLQFDGLNDEIYTKLRGKPLLDIKLKAIKNLQKYKIPITLVTTVTKDVNENNLGEIIEFAQKEKYIRGINFQPVAFFGRVPKEFDPTNRITLTGVIDRIQTQTQTNKNKIETSDFIPLPCNVERVSIGYFIKEKNNNYTSITKKIDIKKHLSEIKNSFAYNVDDFVENNIKKEKNEQELQEEFNPVCNCMKFLKDLKPIIPVNLFLKSKQEKIDYINNNIFRISISSFIDKYNFDLQSMKKECVHVITPDLKRIPFSAYNMIHRNNSKTK